jgi:hypothetical protein
MSTVPHRGYQPAGERDAAGMDADDGEFVRARVLLHDLARHTRDGPFGIPGGEDFGNFVPLISLHNVTASSGKFSRGQAKISILRHNFQG